MITVFGLLLSIFAHVLLSIYSPTLTEPCPAWVVGLSGLLILISQALDNMDGKQARRIGASSALGMLMDHGCDSLNVTVVALSVCSLFQFGGGFKAAVAMFSG